MRRHVKVAEEDLIGWLERLRSEAEELFHDTCQPQQSAELLALMEGVAQSLAGCSCDEADAPAQNSSVMRLARLEFQGQSWLYRQVADQKGLIGLALFNFNRELAEALEQISYNYVTTGTIDALGLQPGTSGQINTGSEFWQQVLEGVGNVQDVLSLQTVQQSRIFQALSETSRQSLHALRQATLGPAHDIWARLSMLFLPALRPQAGNQLTSVRLLSQSLTLIMVSHEVSDKLGLKSNEDFSQEHQKWTMQKQIIAQRQKGLRRTRAGAGPWWDKNAAQNDLQKLEAASADLDSNRPQHMKGVITGQIHTSTISIQHFEELLTTGGQSELRAQQSLKTTNPAAYAARSKAWMDLNLGGTLPVLLAGLGLWNLMATTHAVCYDGHLTGEEKNKLLTSLATSGSLLMALMVMPMWARVGKMTGVLRGRTLELTQAGARVWLKSNLAYSQLAQRLIARTVGMAALNVIAAASEIVEISRKLAIASNTGQRNALYAQGAALLVMGAAGAFQLGGGLAGLYFNFAWIMGGWMIGLLAIAGLVYLVSSILVSLHHREGLRLWLHQCYWGKAANASESTDEALEQSLWQLTHICLTPGVSVRSTNNPYWNELDGAWIQISLPAQLASQVCEIRAVFVRKAGGRRVIPLEPQAYERLAGGYWSPTLDEDPFSHMPPVGGNDKLPGDHSYAADVSHYHWRTWIPVKSASYVELELSYPELDATREPMRYMFRAKLMGGTRTAELISNPLSDKPIDGELLSTSKIEPQLITLPTPVQETSNVQRQDLGPAA